MLPQLAELVIPARAHVPALIAEPLGHVGPAGDQRREPVTWIAGRIFSCRPVRALVTLDVTLLALGSAGRGR